MEPQLLLTLSPADTDGDEKRVSVVNKNLDKVRVHAKEVLGINYKSLMDSEPGRCRRTDGKKWRCRKDVVPDTKYCERHMHRGCSRKRVETCGITSQSRTPTTNYSFSSTPITNCRKKTSLKLKSQNPDETSAKFHTPIPKKHQNKSPVLSVSKTITAVVENDQSSRETNDEIDSVDTLSDNIKDKKGNSTKHGHSTTPEPNTSSKSVVCGNTAEEPQRCKRTDGKRWRCSKEAMPQQKYCGNHMNRGSKRFRQSSVVDTHEVIPAVKVKSDQTNWNKDLSISLGKFPLPNIVDVDSSTSSDDHRH